MISITPLVLATASFLPSTYASAQESGVETLSLEATGVGRGHLTVPVNSLVFDGDEPDWGRSIWLRGASAPALLPRVVIPGCDATLEIPALEGIHLDLSDIRAGSIALHDPGSGDGISGTLFVPDYGGRELVPYPFTIPAGAAAESDRRWREIEASRYRALAMASIPGTAWFRRRAESLGGPMGDLKPWATYRSQEMTDTFAMFSGGRALAENLALSDVIDADEDRKAPHIEISTMDKVDVPELDFRPLVEGLDVEVDPLSRAIPHDQHAVFFPSFAAMLRVADQVDNDAKPLVQLFDGRSQDGRVRERYETQMCLSLNVLARTFGSQFVESVAITGSDTYLRTGSDVAVLFQGSVAAIRGMMTAKIEAAAKEFDVEVTTLEIGGASVTSAVSADRMLSVYLAAGDGFVVVANSPVQVSRVLKAARGDSVSLDELPEYLWFRDRYPLMGQGESADGGEDALAVVSDATIRRWSGARWRIGASRRLRAAALLADAQAWHLGYGMGVGAADEARKTLDIPGGGRVTYDTRFAMDETYGRLSFLTPIAELDLDLVTEAEQLGYELWLEGYQREWTTSFDPIALSLDVTDEKLSMDLTLVPMIVRSDYRELTELAGQVRLKPGVGDFHEGAILHWVSAIDTNSRLYRSMTGFVGGIGNDRFGLDWVGDHVAVYVDRDEEYLARLEDADSFDVFQDEMLPGLPVGMQVGVKSPFKLAAFLTGLRGFIEDAVPGMFDYETREHAGRKYVAIVPADGSMFGETPTIYYVALPDAWVVSFSEKVVQGAIGRSVARAAAGEDAVDEVPAPWTGASTGLHVGSGLKEAFAVDLFQLTARDEMRNRSWSNLAILNEWKLADVEDPVFFHMNEWGIELVCAGGGDYVWNEEYQTMESTVFGHPGAPQRGPILPPALVALKGLGGALTFEEIGADKSRGLRAHVDLKH